MTSSRACGCFVLAGGRRGESLGVSEFTIEEARQAELTSRPPWRKYPRAMLFARAMSQGVRTYCPDVFGTAVYTPEELDAPVNESGELIEATPVTNARARTAAAVANAERPASSMVSGTPPAEEDPRALRDRYQALHAEAGGEQKNLRTDLNLDLGRPEKDRGDVTADDWRRAIAAIEARVQPPVEVTVQADDVADDAGDDPFLEFATSEGAATDTVPEPLNSGLRA